MPSVRARSVEAVDRRTIAGTLAFDGVVDDWPTVVRAALADLPSFTTTSLDDEQAFLVPTSHFSGRWGIQLEFSVTRRGSVLSARVHAPSVLSAKPDADGLSLPGAGAREIRILFTAIADFVAESHD